MVNLLQTSRFYHAPVGFVKERSYEKETTAQRWPVRFADIFDVRHTAITSQQRVLYDQFAAGEQTLTWDAVRQIEIQAMTNLGVPYSYAANAVAKAIQQLLSEGHLAPTHIP